MDKFSKKEKKKTFFKRTFYHEIGLEVDAL